MKKIILVIFVLIILPSSSRSWNHSELQWYSFETEHFTIHYTDGFEDMAVEAARVAEDIYGPVTSFYGYAPKDKVHLIIKGNEDFAGGETYYYLNKIEITTTFLDFIYRGTSNWLWNVITHEFIHIISSHKSMKLPIEIPSLYFQVISFETEKRPDVLTGYPNFQVSFPFPGEVLPNWFAEGLSQFQCSTARYDIWDTHRDMLLRMAALDGKLLSLSEMGVFGKKSIGNELVYNQGFSLVRYIAQKYGKDKLNLLIEKMSSPFRLNFSGACRSVLGISDRQLYREWEESLKAHYNSVRNRIGDKRVEGEIIFSKAFASVYPVALRESNRIFFLSNIDRDYLSFSLYSLDSEGKLKKLSSDVVSRPSISPDGNFICYIRATRKNKFGYRLNDLFVYELSTGKEVRVTRGLRVYACDWSPDGKRIVCAVFEGGGMRLAVIEYPDGNVTFAPEDDRNIEYFGLSWGRKGILATVFDGVSRNIELIDPVNFKREPVLHSSADERDCVWSEDGEGFLYSSDKTGIFNIYYYSLSTGQSFRIVLAALLCHSRGVKIYCFQTTAQVDTV